MALARPVRFPLTMRLLLHEQPRHRFSLFPIRTGTREYGVTSMAAHRRNLLVCFLAVSAVIAILAALPWLTPRIYDDLIEFVRRRLFLK